MRYIARIMLAALCVAGAAAWSMSTWCPVTVQAALHLPSLDHVGTSALAQNADLITRIVEKKGLVGHLPWPVQAGLVKQSAAFLDAGDTLGHRLMHQWATSITSCADHKDPAFFPFSK